jgi:hypothetical protein
MDGMTRVTAVALPSPASVCRSMAAWLRVNRTEVSISAGLVALAATLRLVYLGDIPPGLHGDEAIAGLEARSLLDRGTLVHGDLGPYSLDPMGARKRPLLIKLLE